MSLSILFLELPFSSPLPPSIPPPRPSLHYYLCPWVIYVSMHIYSLADLFPFSPSILLPSEICQPVPFIFFKKNFSQKKTMHILSDTYSAFINSICFYCLFLLIGSAWHLVFFWDVSSFVQCQY